MVRSTKRSSRYSKPNQRRHTGAGRNKGLLAVNVSLAALSIIGGGYLALHFANIPQVDQTTACYEDFPSDVHAFVVDTSFGGNAATTHRRSLSRALVNAHRKLPANGRQLVFANTQSTDASIVEPLLDVCRPAKDSQEQRYLSEQLPRDPAILNDIQEMAERQFTMQLNAVMGAFGDGAENSKNSPIIEQVQSASRYDFPDDLTRFTLLTDGIQNSSLAHFCVVQGDMPPYDVFEKRNARFEHLRPESFVGVEVEVLLVEFGPLPDGPFQYCSTQELRDWWEDFFYGQDAAKVTITPLRAGAQ